MAVLSVSAGNYQATLVDISCTGARLTGEYLPAVGQQVEFRAEGVRVAAVVVWSEPGASAAEFDTPKLRAVKCRGFERWVQARWKAAKKHPASLE